NAKVAVVHTETGAARNVMTDNSGRWIVSNLASGNVRVSVDANGFKRMVRTFNYDGSRPAPFIPTLNTAAMTETVEVTSSSPTVAEYQHNERDIKKQAAQQQLRSEEH